jgi:Protein of unknown function (DUF3800)
VPIQGYVDDSGTQQDVKFVFSALIAEAEAWSIFSDEWQRCLDCPPRIQYFKMDEAVGRDGQFYGWNEQERNAKLRLLCGVINQLKATEVSAIAKMREFSVAWGRTAGKPLSYYYFFPFHVVNLAVAHALGELGYSQPYEIFFDEHKIYGRAAKEWYPIIRAMQVKQVQDLMPIEPFFRTDTDVLPLQAADMVAWLVRRRSTFGDKFDFAWVDDELAGLTHSPFTKEIGWKPSDGIFDKTDPEYRATMKAGLDAFREAFGFDWPPKTKDQLKKARGRK